MILLTLPVTLMPKSLESHSFAALFPELPPEELRQLSRDIKEHGQLEPIVVYQGLILDGRNRYKACQMAGIRPRVEEFNPRIAKRSPEEFVLSRNLRRRHLSVGQKAAIALDWSEQIEVKADPEKKKALGRPRSPISGAAKQIGINEQRVFEVRQVRDASRSLFQEVKTGRRSLNSALAEITPLRDSRPRDFLPEEFGGDGQKLKVHSAPDGDKAPRDLPKLTRRAAVAADNRPPNPAAVEKALLRIKAILGTWFYAEVKARNLIQEAQAIVQLAKLPDGQMLEIGTLLKKGWRFEDAFREVMERLTPDDEIRALHTQAVAKGGNWCLLRVGDFGHVVVWGSEKDKALTKVKDTLGRAISAPRA